jgi:pimeloyl-ACP methyl ester carboxylesterase
MQPEPQDALASAAEPSPPSDMVRVAPASVPGIYRWTDCRYMHGWRMQVHFRGRLFRLLDPRGRVLHQGPEADCRHQWMLTAQRHALVAPHGRMIVLLHGLARNAWTMMPLARFLAKQWPGTEVINFQYASTAAPIADHARRLIEFLRYAQDAQPLHLIGHSLGNIVLRRAFRLAEEGKWDLPRLGRVVMLGPPNQGSQIATRLKVLGPLAWFNGAPFRELGCDWSTFEAELAIPPCEFGIVAGNIPWLERVHPLVSGPSDVIVSVEETRLTGATDHLVVGVPHAWLMASRRVQQATLRFLQTGRFAEGENVASPVHS